MTGADARTEVLRRIRAALRGATAPALPDPPDIHAHDASADDRAALARRFRDALRMVGGDARFVATEDDLPQAIAAYTAERGFGAAAADLAVAEYALVRATALFADTGSTLVIERAADRRLAPYLPRTCIVVGDAADLHAHLTTDSMRSAYDAARCGDRGEAVIITGPSRTADVEKTLVLGAHGPRDVVVFVVGVVPDEGGGR